jgi:hypothetical protein
MYISTFFVLTQFFLWKTDILRGLCKKDKKTCREKVYFITKFCHFYIEHIKSWFRLKRLFEHVEHEDVHITFLFKIFYFFQICQNCISNKGCICQKKVMSIYRTCAKTPKFVNNIAIETKHQVFTIKDLSIRLRDIIKLTHKT